MGSTHIRTIHRLARLQVEARPYIQRVYAQKRHEQSDLQYAAEHAAILAIVLRFGQPRMDEPLWRACERCEASGAWKECCRRFLTALGRGHKFRPYERRNFSKIAEPVRHAIDWFIPGVNEKDKLNRVFKSAPPWFVWFTFADHSAKKLGLTVSDLSSVARFHRSHRPLVNYDWYDVPEGKFERRQWKHGEKREPPVYAALANSEAKNESLSPRERQRAGRYNAAGQDSLEETWPKLTPIEVLEFTQEEWDQAVRADFDREVIYAILKRKYPQKFRNNRTRL